MDSNLFFERSLVVDKPVIIDTGTDTIKSGFSDDISPRIITPTVIGYVKSKSTLSSTRESPALEYYVGEKALINRRVNNLIRPLNGSTFDDWESIERIWHYLFYNDLKINPMYHPLLIAEPIFIREKDKLKIAEIMFETFCVPAIYFANSSLLALYATGKISGIIVDLGAHNTTLVPFYEGFIIPQGIKQSAIGGHHITEFLHKLLGYLHNSMKKSSYRVRAREIKETLCYVSLNATKELDLMQKYPGRFAKNYILPDGEHLPIIKERIKATELLFDPHLNGFPDSPLPELIVQSIQNCDIDMRLTLYNNIILCGGGSSLFGLKERLTYELNSLLGEKIPFSIHTPNENQYLTWVGGSLLSSINTFPNLWLSRKQYQESGLN